MKTLPSTWILRGYVVLFLTLPWSVEWSFGSWSLLFPAEPLIGLLGIGLFFDLRRFDFNSLKVNLLMLFVVAWAVWLTVATMTSTLPLVSWKYWLVEIGQIWVFYGGQVLFPGLWRRVFPFFVASLTGVAVYALAHHGVSYHFRVDQSPMAARPFFADHTVFGAVLGLAGVGLVGQFFGNVPFFSFDAIVIPCPESTPPPAPPPKGRGARSSFEIVFPQMMGDEIQGSKPPSPSGEGPGEGLTRGRGWLREQRKAWKTFTIFFLSIFLIALFLTFSRAAWLSVLLAGTLGAWLVSPAKWRWALLAALAATLAAGLFFQEKIAARLAADVSSQERLNRYSCAARMAADRPWAGFGPGTFPFQYLAYQRPDEMTRISVTQPIARRGPENYGRGGGAHSEYFQAWAELGWPGLLLWVSLVGGALASGCWTFFRSKTETLRWWALLMTLSLLTFFLHGLVNNFLHDARVAALVWGQLALCSGWWRNPTNSA